MNYLNRIDQSEQAALQYATAEEFCRVFAQEMDGLYQLSFLLTGNHALAERCFVAGLEDCTKENHIFREWARSWAKRTIIQNAIRELRPHPYPANSPGCGTTRANGHESDSSRRFEENVVLALADFERFVFVMSVLEHYTIHECALLFGCSQRQVLDARSRALLRLVGFQCERNCEDLQEASR
jgi:DNA-directed RNA polymerase specialized sigma24 family protein